MLWLRSMISVAYKNLVGARRASWRILQSVEQSELSKNNEKRVALIQKYRSAVEKELDDVSSLLWWTQCFCKAVPCSSRVQVGRLLTQRIRCCRGCRCATRS